MMTISLNLGDSDVDGLLSRLESLLADPEELNAIIETGATTSVKSHLAQEYSTKPNRLGAPSTGYWKSAAESIIAVSGADGVLISIPWKGVKLKYHGGIVTASGRTSEVTGKPIRMLSIPVHPAAHGRTISDLGGSRVFYRKGGGIFFRHGEAKSPSDPLYFILRKSVSINPDKNILPPDAAIVAACMEALMKRLPLN